MYSDTLTGPIGGKPQVRIATWQMKEYALLLELASRSALRSGAAPHQIGWGLTPPELDEQSQDGRYGRPKRRPGYAT